MRAQRVNKRFCLLKLCNNHNKREGQYSKGESGNFTSWQLFGDIGKCLQLCEIFQISSKHSHISSNEINIRQTFSQRFGSVQNYCDCPGSVTLDPKYIAIHLTQNIWRSLWELGNQFATNCGLYAHSLTKQLLNNLQFAD